MSTPTYTKHTGRVTAYTDLVASTVRAEVARAGVRQRQLVALLDLPASSVSARWRGVTPWTVDELSRIAHLLAIPMAHLMPGSTEPAEYAAERRMLPRLDSNQQPADYAYWLVSALLADILARSAGAR